jgi:hypothetical protein
MSLKCGIVGLPNVGKSTLFNALTKAGIAAENYPFCTIEPNVGIVEVPDPRLAAADRHRQAAACPASDRRICRHRRAGRRGLERRRPGQPVPGQHPRDRRHRQCRTLLRRRKCRPCLGPRRPALGHRNDHDRTGARRPGRRRTYAQPREQESPLRRQGSATTGRRPRTPAATPQRRPSGTHADTFRGRKNRAQATLPADHQADDVRRQRPRRRFREQPLS